MPTRAAIRADVPTVPPLGDSRARVLGVLQDANAPLGVAEVAERVGLHTNTARFHLDGLVDAGLAVRSSEARDQPGRPRSLYAASANSAPVGRRSYRLLAEILTSYLASQNKRPDDAALAAGTEWGRFLATPPGPFRQVSAAEATEQLIDVLDDVGFAPQSTAARRGRQQVVLHHCPFREAAEEHRDVVCSVHLGLMRGLLDEIDAPVQVQRLDPFVEPDIKCVTHLVSRRRPGAPARRAG
jgi:predicted ArsR family transcriptional regulator